MSEPSRPTRPDPTDDPAPEAAAPGAAEAAAGPDGLREPDRAAADRLLRHAVTRHARQAPGPVDRDALLARARAGFDAEIAPAGAAAYADYRAALRAAAAGPASAPRPAGPLLAAVTAGAAGAAADLAHGLGAGAAAGTGVLAAVVGAAAGGGWQALAAARARRAVPDPDRARRRWLAVLDLDGVLPFLAGTADPPTVPAPRTAPGRAPVADTATAPPDPTAPPAADRTRPPAAPAPGAAGRPAPGGPATQVPRAPRRPDRSAAARQRALLEQSFAALPETPGPYAGHHAHLADISRWVQHARASTETRPTVVTLRGPAGSGRSTLAVRAAKELRGQFRGVCVVSLRGAGTAGEEPLTTREALLHLLNRFGAPREQLLFRELPSREDHLSRLSELYHRHLAGLPVVIVLDDARDADQVRALVPAGSESLVLVTCAEPLELDLPDAWVRDLPVPALADEDASALLAEFAGRPPAALDAAAVGRVNRLCGGLPLALRVAGRAAGDRRPAALAEALAAGSGDGTAATGGAASGSTAAGPAKAAAPGPAGATHGAAGGPVGRALAAGYRDLPADARRLLRRLALAGRASLGAGAAAALLDSDEMEAAALLTALDRAGLVEHVRARRYRLHDLVRDFAQERLAAEEDEPERTAARERLIRTYARLADSVIRLVDGKTSTRADALPHGAVGAHGFRSLDQALRWLDEESSFITATVRGAQGVDTAAVLHLLGALCDYCLLRGDLYRLGEISELTQAVDQGLLTRSVRWRTGIAARQIGDLDRARSTLSSVVDLYVAAEQPAGAARARASLGITLHHQGELADAADKLREALEAQRAAGLRGDQGWTLHALAAVRRDQGDVAEASALLRQALELHRENESVRGQAWAHLQLGQTHLCVGATGPAERELARARSEHTLAKDARGAAWTLTQLARVRLRRGEPAAAVAELDEALARHRENGDARGEAWTLYHLAEAQEEAGRPGEALRSLERARTVFSRMRDALGLAASRHHLGRLTRDERARQVGNLRNSGFARQLLQDARADFRRLGVPHGQAWSCLELAVIDAANERAAEALALTEEAVQLFAGLGDLRGEDWARFLRCTLLPLVRADGAGTAARELAELLAAGHAERDPAVTEYAAAWSAVLRRGLAPGAAWDAWRLGMTPSRVSQDHMSPPVGQG